MSILCSHRLGRMTLFAVIWVLAGHAAAEPSLNEMRRQVVAASERSPQWHGPVSGPAGVEGKRIAVFCEDLRNGGILGVAQGMDEAAKVMRWQVRIFDAGGTPGGREKAVAEALAMGPDGLAVVGADAESLRTSLQAFARKGIPIVGWHVASRPGPVENTPVAMNITTDPLEVARITAMAAVVASQGRAGVVIFTDSNFGIAMAKANAMARVIRACKQCSLLEVRDVPISGSAEKMPAVTRELLALYGRRWTHALAINDIYFDYAVQELNREPAGRGVALLSAGDGSAAAFMRIQAGISQTGSVAEPLNLHGWQMVDELNRLLAGQPVSGFVMQPHLVTAANAGYDGGSDYRYDPENGYREIYRRIWRR